MRRSFKRIFAFFVAIGVVSAVSGTRAAPAYSRGDTTWYIGFAVGAGGGQDSYTGTHFAAMGAGASVMFKVGAVLGPYLLLGYETTGWGAGTEQNGEDCLLNFQHNDAMLTYFPWTDLGFFVKGGAGFALHAFGPRHSFDRGDIDAGFSLRVGGGYEFQLLEAFNLGIELAYGAGFFKPGTSQEVSGMLTFSWY